MNVLVLHDMLPPEAPPELVDNLIQAEQLYEILALLGHQPFRIAMTEDIEETTREIKKRRPQIVFNLVESIYGQGRDIYLAPLLLERSGVPFTGSGSEAIRLTNDKVKAKRLMKSAGLPTPEWLTIEDMPSDVDRSKRYIVKSVHEHASFELDEDSVFSGLDPERLLNELSDRSRKLGGEWFAEQYIDGREFNLSLLANPGGMEVLPPAEIVFENYAPEKTRVVGYRAKWLADSFEFNHTPRRFDFQEEEFELIEVLKRLSLECRNVFNLRGWARVDFRVDDRNRPWILEVNTNPCLSADAGFMAAASRAGISPDMVIQSILNDAVK